MNENNGLAVFGTSSKESVKDYDMIKVEKEETVFFKHDKNNKNLIGWIQP